MTIEKLVKYGKRTLATGLASAMIFAAGCADAPKHKSNPPVNPSPITENIAPMVDSHSVDFLNGYSGVFDVVGQASDPDGYVDRVEVDDGSEIIGVYNTAKSNPFNFKTSSFSIPMGNAEYRIRAFDDRGAMTEVADGFTTATEAPVRNMIRGVLIGKGYTEDPMLSGPKTFYTDMPLGVTNHSPFLVDFLLRRDDNSTSVIEYIGESDNEQTELNQRAILNTEVEGLPKLYMNKLPLDVADTWTNSYADNGFQ